jgi:RNA polymerase sigma factor, sigma-70 family
MKLFGLGKYSEKQIAEDIRNGSNAAVKNLYDESSGYLLALCSRYIADHAAAEDVLQDSFLKILSSIGSFTWKGNGSLKAWMSRIMVNEALQYLRKQKKSSFIDYGDRLPDMTDEDDDPEVESVPPEVIQKMIQELPDGYRTIFNLVVFEEKPHKEIADLLGITESTSASQFHRARKILAKKINDYVKQHQ